VATSDHEKLKDGWWNTSVERPLRALAQRVLMIGLDGATFDILGPMMAQGRMPTLSRLIKEGASGILLSTIPPITPAAWTTFMTGKGPGRHGIFDFERYNVRTNELSFNSVYEIKERTIWQILGDAGLRVGSIQVPMTYPPRPVNGFMITGFETPGTDTDFTYPRELKDELLSRWPNFTFKTKWKRKTFGGNTVFKENLEYIKRSFDQGVNITEFCGEKYGWDVMMVLYKLVDNLQHKTWKYLDPKTAHRNPKRAELCAQCFNYLDKCIGRLTEYAQSRNATIMIMSDHGHGPLDGKVQPNLLLRHWDYLAVAQKAQATTRTKHIIRKWFGKKKGKFAANYGIEHDLAIDWTKTTAVVAHAGMCGFLYINLKGRQETGIVDPKDYDALRAEIANKLLKVRVKNPQGKTVRVFSAIHKPEVLYDCSREEYEWLPDLMLVPIPGLAVVRKIRGRWPVLWSSFRKLEGTHRMEGVFIAHGPSISQTNQAKGNMADIAPTLLSMLGLRIPSDMDGHVMEQTFSTRPAIELEPPQAPDSKKDENTIYDEQQQAILTERLTDLGYLE